MFKKTIGLMALLMSLSQATASSYKGTGKATINSEVEISYSTTLTIEHLEENKTARFTEVGELAGGKTYKDSYVLRMGNKGAITIEKNDAVVGNGYCFPQKNDGKWCDYKYASAFGPVHINMYYDGETRMIHRVGDEAVAEGNVFWSDTLILDKK